MNYQQDNWTEWLVAAEFQYNDKKHVATGRTSFELNFGRHPWKGDITVQTEFPKLEEFLISLQRSWEEATKVLWDALDRNHFYFLLFSDFIRILFFFSFSFLFFWMIKRHVTSQSHDVSHDVTS